MTDSNEASMTHKHLRVVGGLLVGACLVWVLTPSPAGVRESDGLWRVEWTRTNGQIRRRERELWLFRGYNVTLFSDDGLQDVQITLRPDTHPKQIDTSQLFVRYGIYEVRGDELWVARAPEIVPRPTDFDELRALHTIAVLRRIAPDARQGPGELAKILVAEYGPRPEPRPRRTFDRQAEEYVARTDSRAVAEPGGPDTRSNMLWNIRWLILEVNNGGFRQFFINSIGDNAADISRQLRLIGAVKTAAMVDKGCSVFPEGKPAIDMDTRRQQVLQFTIREDDVLNEIDEDFYARDEDLCLLLKKYLEAKPPQPDGRP